MLRSFFCLCGLLLYCSLSAQLWQEDFATAQVMAQEREQNLVLVFSGSDWCAPCIKLEREIWKQAGFVDAAAASFLFYKADFPRRKANRLSPALAKINEGLAKQYNDAGRFPLVVVLSPEGEVLGQAGYQKSTPAAYLTLLKSFGQ